MLRKYANNDVVIPDPGRRMAAWGLIYAAVLTNGGTNSDNCLRAGSCGSGACSGTLPGKMSLGNSMKILTGVLMPACIRLQSGMRPQENGLPTEAYGGLSI